MKTNLYRSNNLAITANDLQSSDDIEENVATVLETPKRLMGPRMKAKQVAAAIKQQGRKGRKQQITVDPETDEDEIERETRSRKRKRPVAVVESDNDDDDDDDDDADGPPAKSQYLGEHEINE